MTIQASFLWKLFAAVLSLLISFSKGKQLDRRFTWLSWWQNEPWLVYWDSIVSRLEYRSLATRGQNLSHKSCTRKLYCTGSIDPTLYPSCLIIRNAISSHPASLWHQPSSFVPLLVVARPDEMATGVLMNYLTTQWPISHIKLSLRMERHNLNFCRA